MNSRTAFRMAARLAPIVATIGLATGCSVEPSGQTDLAQYILDNYTKREYRIPMRDGVTLHTAVYAPKDDSQSYPFLMRRTPYCVCPR